MPQLLQPLMDDDSPVADVFDSCSICDQLTLENSQVSMVGALKLLLLYLINCQILIEIYLLLICAPQRNWRDRLNAASRWRVIE